MRTTTTARFVLDGFFSPANIVLAGMHGRVVESIRLAICIYRSVRNLDKVAGMTDQARRKPRRTPAQIREFVNRYRESGLPRNRFAAREDICLATLHRYLKRANRGTAQTVPRLLEVGTIGAHGGREPYKVRFTTGVRVEIPAGFCHSEVAGLLEPIGRAL